MTTTARCTPSHLLHTFPEIWVILGEMWGNTGLIVVFFKSVVDTYEDQILRVMIEAYRLALR